METKQGQNMTVDRRNEYLKPFVLTTILREQMLNLVEDNEGVNIILKPENRGIKKDKFSAFEYGLYYIKQMEDSKRKKKKRFNANISKKKGGIAILSEECRLQSKENYLKQRGTSYNEK